MATLKEAVQSAVAFAADTLGPERTKEIRLEEVESSEDSWKITLSMVAPEPVKSTLAIAALIGRDAREYKVFTVSKATGAVEAMKIRELSAS